jgi:hypothetical protein
VHNPLATSSPNGRRAHRTCLLTAHVALCFGNSTWARLSLLPIYNRERQTNELLCCCSVQDEPEPARREQATLTQPPSARHRGPQTRGNIFIVWRHVRSQARSEVRGHTPLTLLLSLTFGGCVPLFSAALRLVSRHTEPAPHLGRRSTAEGTALPLARKPQCRAVPRARLLLRRRVPSSLQPWAIRLKGKAPLHACALTATAQH